MSFARQEEGPTNVSATAYAVPCGKIRGRYSPPMLLS